MENSIKNSMKETNRKAGTEMSTQVTNIPRSNKILEAGSFS
jgi:hypothetical protein